MDIHSLDDTCQYQKELDVFVGRSPGFKRWCCHPRSGTSCSLSGTIDACKGLLMEEDRPAPCRRHLLKGIHHNLVVVNGLVHTPHNGGSRAGQEPPSLCCALAGTPNYSFLYLHHSVRTDSLTDGAESNGPPAPGPWEALLRIRVRPV